MKTLPGLLVLGLVLAGGTHGAAPPKTPRELTPEEHEKVEQLREQLNRHLGAGKFEEAVQAARQIADYRAEQQGAGHWQVHDARLEVERRQRLTTITAKDRAEEVRAMSVSAEGMRLQQRLRYREAEPKLREALAIRQKLLGEQHPHTSTSYSSLAICMHLQGKHDEALLLFQKALDIRLKVLGEQHPDTAFSYNNVAGSLDSLGKHDEALPLYRKALTIHQKVQGEEHPNTGTSYNNVAFCLNRQGKHAEALPLLQKAVTICRKVLGEQHISTATSYSNLATCLHSQGKHDEAMPLYQKALTCFQKLLGEQHPNTATSYNNVAMCLNRQGKHAEALPLLQKALDIRQKVLGEQHPDTARSYDNVASCLHEQGRQGEAQPLFHKALAIRLQVWGEQHPETATSYNNLATCLNSQGKHADAVLLWQKALDIRRKVLGEQHADTALSYNNMASSLDDQGKHAEAFLLYEKALAIRCKVFVEPHPDIAQSYNNVAMCLNDQGKPAEALPLLQKALDIRQKVLGEQHPDTAHSYINLATCLHSQGKHDEAMPLYHKALAIYRKVLGEQHPYTARGYNSAAVCVNDQGKHVEAVQHWEKALLGHESGRLNSGSSGFDRTFFRADYYSPRALLAGTLVRLHKPLPAWQYAEADLARGLLDDLLPSAESAADAQRRTQIDRLNQELLPLLTREVLDAEQTKQRDSWLKERGAMRVEMAASAARRSAEGVFPLERIQKWIRADAAIVFWLDVLDQHLGCILRSAGPPVWVKLPGTGRDNAWTDADTSLAQRALDALAESTSDSAARRRLLEQLHRQRIAPLEPHLKGVRLLAVVSAGLMAKVPVEALTERYTVCYTPSASVFARRLEPHRALEASSLLVLADPVFTRSAPVLPPAPPHGLLVKAVTPGGVGARIGLVPGDVLLQYGDKKLASPDDLKPTTGDDRVPIKLWREGKEMAGRIPAGSLGVIIDRRPIAEALADWRKQEGSLRSVGRGRDWPALPGTRLEARTLAALVPSSITLLGSEASEQQLAALAASGKLKDYRLLHLATHGQANAVRPKETALILAQDKLPAMLEEEVKVILSGEKPLDGRLTVGTIIDRWQLDADLVVLSACQTGLGQATSRDGMLGFTQALLQKGARSVVLSRWKVDDAATALLMERFHRNLLGKREGLKDGMKRAEALAEAKTWLRQLSRAEAEKRLALLVDGVPRGERGRIKAALPTRKPDEPKGDDRPFAHPYYWAAFVLLGDPF